MNRRFYLALLALIFAASCGGTPLPSATPLPPSPTATLLPTSTPLPTATLLPTGTPLPTATPLPSPTPLPTSTPLPTATPLPSPTPQPSPTRAPAQAVMDRAGQVVAALAGRDMAALAAFVHPELGLRFSPYAYVQESDRVFPPDRVPGLLDDPTVYLWGAYDGSGLPIELTFAAYYERFVYDQDFQNAEQVSLNRRLGQGNSIDNSAGFYPGAMVVEYHFSGFDPQYAGMDWRSLRLVFLERAGVWYLAGIIHDEWTI